MRCKFNNLKIEQLQAFRNVLLLAKLLMACVLFNGSLGPVLSHLLEFQNAPYSYTGSGRGIFGSIALAAEPEGSKLNPYPHMYNLLEYHGHAKGNVPVLSSGDLQVYLETKIIKDRNLEQYQTKITLIEKKAPKFIWTSPPSLTDFPVTIRILELDQNNQDPEILMESFTGGGSCCFEVMALTKQNNLWKKATLPPLREIHLTTAKDDDGVSALVSADERFIGRFDCNACSYAPSRIFRLKNDEFQDVTLDPKYQYVHLSDLKQMNLWFDSPHYEGVNGFLTGFVASMAIVGRYQEAKLIMGKSFDRKSDIGLKSCAKPVSLQKCHANDIVKKTFPSALQELLSESGLIK